MAEMVADLLQAQPLSDQVRRAGMAKTMWAVVRGPDAQGAQAAVDRVIKAALRKRTKRGLERHKQISTAASGRPGPLKIVQNRVAD